MSEIKCPKCGSGDVDITFGPTEVTTKVKNGKVITTVNSDKFAICQNCGHSWLYVSEADMKLAKFLLAFIVILFIVVYAILWL